MNGSGNVLSIRDTTVNKIDMFSPHGCEGCKKIWAVNKVISNKEAKFRLCNYNKGNKLGDIIEEYGGRVHRVGWKTFLGKWHLG